MVALVVAGLALGGCAGPDLAKRTFTRTTVPAAVADNTSRTTSPATNRSSTPGQPTDAAFAVDKLRLVDPCALLDHSTLNGLGSPADDSPSNFDSCSNYMKDKQGKDLSVTVHVGESLTSEVSKADKTIGGLPAAEQKLDDNSACFVTLVTQADPGLGITVQIGYQADDPCAPGRTVAEAITNRMRSNPPLRQVDKRSLITVDPCAVVDKAAVTAAVGDATAFPFGLHNCSWNSNSTEIAVDMRLGYDPKDNKLDDNQKSVDLGGGITGYQVASNATYPSCRLAWKHPVPVPGSDMSEILEIRFDDVGKVNVDPCQRSQDFAKALLPKLPAA